MPQKRQPMRLEELAVKAVGEWVKLVGDGVAELLYIKSRRDITLGQILLRSFLDFIRESINASINCYLSDKTAEQILKSVSDHIDETKAAYDSNIPMPKFINKIRVIVTFTEVAMLRNLKRLNVSCLPNIMRHVINQNLCRLEGLEHLDLGSGLTGWDTSKIEKYVMFGLKYMTNLKSFSLFFDCTNTIINVLGNNCLGLKELDIYGSNLVNDLALPSLLNCKKLKEVILFGTSVTVTGYRDLLLGLPNIQYLGGFKDFRIVLEMLHEQKSSPLSLATLEFTDMSNEQLKRLISYCPNLVSVSILCNEIFQDITIFEELHNMKSLNIYNCAFFTHHVKQLLECIGKQLDVLRLENAKEVDMNALICISQFCPNLITLTLGSCKFSDDRLIHFDLKRLSVPPFACLKKLVCVSDCSVHHLLFLIQYSKNIKYIELRIRTGINDETISRVLAVNPMKSLEELRILDRSYLSMSTVRLLMTHCDQLCELGNLETWEGISLTELIEFKEYIRSNNININLVGLSIM